MGIKIRIVAILFLLIFLGAFLAILKHTGTVQSPGMIFRMENG
ncbi:MAG: hypothetical protein Q7R64_04705 [bacterium]|nr:hypothetical protein [bacterium]